MSESHDPKWVSKLGLALGSVTGFLLFLAMGVFGVGLLWSMFQIPQESATVATGTSAATAPAMVASAPASGGPASVAAAAPAEPVDPELAKLMEVGQQAYQICLACHGPAGVAIAANLAPNLIGSDVVGGPGEPLAMILLKGIQPEGRYAGAMIGWAPQFDDEQIAGVITYIRNSFGNSFEKVTPETVAAARAKYADRQTAFTRAELEAAAGSEG